MDNFNCSMLSGTSICPTENGPLNDQMAPNKTSCELQWSPGCVTITNDDKKTPLIDNELKRELELYINVIGFIVTSMLGVVGNVINIAVYWKQGLTNSITLGFFALSISDLILVAMPLFTGSMYAAKYVLQDSNVDFSSVHYVSFGWVRNFTYSCSLLITAFLSLERCCCIVLPFKVQTIFTRKRTAIFLTLMFLFHAACLCLLPAIVQLKWLPSSSMDMNSSSSPKKLRVKFSDFGREIEVFYSTSMSFVVPVGCQVIVTVCAFVMVRGLRKSSQFRAQVTSAGNKNPAQNTTSEKKGLQNKYQPNESTQDSNSSNPYNNDNSELDKNGRSDDLNLKTPSSNSNGSTLSERDARLVRTMVFLVCILSACNVPFLVATFAWRTIPDLNIGRPYQNTLSVIFSIVYILGNLNASSNIVVYYKTSARFKQVADQLFCATKKV